MIPATRRSRGKCNSVTSHESPLSAEPLHFIALPHRISAVHVSLQIHGSRQGIDSTTAPPKCSPPNGSAVTIGSGVVLSPDLRGGKRASGRETSSCVRLRGERCFGTSVVTCAANSITCKREAIALLQKGCVRFNCLLDGNTALSVQDITERIETLLCIRKPVGISEHLRMSVEDLQDDFLQGASKTWVRVRQTGGSCGDERVPSKFV